MRAAPRPAPPPPTEPATPPPSAALREAQQMATVNSKYPRSTMMFARSGWTFKPCLDLPPLSVFAPTNLPLLDKQALILHQFVEQTRDTTCMLRLEQPARTRPP